MKNLVISESEFEQYTGEAKEHYLYKLVPASVQIKVNKILKSGIAPVFYDREKQELLDDLLANGDILIYADIDNFAQAKEIYDALTDAISILAFCPYGVEIFGFRYEVIDG
jgi:hypothetical protein